MTPNGARIRAQSRKEVYDRLHRIRLEAQEQIKYLKMLLSVKGTDQTELVKAKTCIDHNANSQLLQDQLLDRLWAAEKHAWSLEAERDNLNIRLSEKVLELNKLQLLYSNQSMKLLVAERDRATSSSSRETSSCDLSIK
nr:uncharacterized protein LOC119181627 isoform X2 [Rhipicephalus microplus]